MNKAGTSDFGLKARQGTATIGDIRKAELAKDLDPTILKVYFHLFYLFIKKNHFYRFVVIQMKN